MPALSGLTLAGKPCCDAAGSHARWTTAGAGGTELVLHCFPKWNLDRGVLNFC